MRTCTVVSKFPDGRTEIVFSSRIKAYRYFSKTFKNIYFIVPDETRTSGTYKKVAIVNYKGFQYRLSRETAHFEFETSNQSFTRYTIKIFPIK